MLRETSTDPSNEDITKLKDKMVAMVKVYKTIRGDVDKTSGWGLDGEDDTIKSSILKKCA